MTGWLNMNTQHCVCLFVALSVSPSPYPSLYLLSLPSHSHSLSPVPLSSSESSALSIRSPTSSQWIAPMWNNLHCTLSLYSFSVLVWQKTSPWSENGARQERRRTTLPTSTRCRTSLREAVRHSQAARENLTVDGYGLHVTRWVSPTMLRSTGMDGCCTLEVVCLLRLNLGKCTNHWNLVS